MPRLQLEMKTQLEYVLSIFKQENFHNNDHHIKNYSYETEDELMKKILNRLGKAAGDEKLRKELDLEEMAMREYEKALEPYEQKLRIQEKMIEEKDKALGEKDKILEAMDKVIAEKEKLIRDMMDKLGKK